MKDAIDYSAHRFLVVDDKQFIRLMVQSLLEKMKAREILTANSGADALKLLRRLGSRVTCVISDWNMSPISGLQLLQSIRAADVPDLPPETCVILLTGHAHATVVKAAVQLDVQGYIVKPVSYDKLSQAIGLAMTKKIKLKPPESYREVKGLEVPATFGESGKKSPPWVAWASKSPQRRKFEEGMNELRREVLSEAMETGGASEIINVKRRAIEQINVGMVMAEDVYDAEGHLLVGKGTVLSARVLARLRTVIAVSEHAVRLWVGESAAQS